MPKSRLERLMIDSLRPRPRTTKPFGDHVKSILWENRVCWWGEYSVRSSESEFKSGNILWQSVRDGFLLWCIGIASLALANSKEQADKFTHHLNRGRVLLLRFIRLSSYLACTLHSLFALDINPRTREDVRAQRELSYPLIKVSPERS